MASDLKDSAIGGAVDLGFFALFDQQPQSQSTPQVPSTGTTMPQNIADPSSFGDVARRASSSHIGNNDRVDLTRDDEVVEDSQDSDQEYVDVLSASMTSRKRKALGRPQREEPKTSQKTVATQKAETDEEIFANGPSRQRIIEVGLMPLKQRMVELPDCFHPLKGHLKAPWRKLYEGDLKRARGKRDGDLKKARENIDAGSQSELPEDVPSKEQFLEVALLPVRDRAAKLPDCFYASGEPRPPYKKAYGEDFRKQREEVNAAKARGEIPHRKKDPGLDLLRSTSNDQEASEDNDKPAKNGKSVVKIIISTKPKPQKQLSQQPSPVPFPLLPQNVSDKATPEDSLQERYPAVLNAPEPSPITPTQVDTPTPAHRKSQGPNKVAKSEALDNIVQLEDPSTLQNSINIKNGANAIRCSMTNCKLSPFIGDKLAQLHGIKLEDVQEGLRKHGCWFCPYCLPKVQAMQTGSSQNSVAQLPVPQAIPLADHLSKLTTKFGEGFLDDDDIRAPLLDLTALVEQYTANACTEPSRLFPRLPILSIPCVQNEFQGNPERLVVVLRKMLDVPAGISIASIARQLRLENDHGFWVNSVLVFMIVEFVFKNGSPFDSPLVWREGFKYLGLSAKITASIIQDNRLRTMEASPRPAEFAARLQTRQGKFVEELNATMLPLVGFSAKIIETHKAIATAAQELNLLTRAYTSRYRAIWPKMGDKFKNQEHTLNGLVSEKDEGRTILLTKLLGLKVEIEGGDWRVCRKAEVALLPDAPKEPAPASIIPQKRQYELIE